MRQKYPTRKLWVIFEPRSNTTKRNVFQQQLADALGGADAVVIPAIEDPQKVAADERLDVQKLMADVKSAGTDAWQLDSVEDIVQLVGSESQDGDVIAVLSNGGFEGIHQRLLDRLA